MSRKLRLEFPGACYHVINRGNYRTDAFLTDRTKAAFVDCLFAACHRSEWLLHAFVVMRNHYHLALETPQGNLVAGMHWLQSTFANRFNRLRDERGHLFQGRYKALVVEPGEALAQVCHYIHLNPVRAGILPVSGLRQYAASSYGYLWRPERRPAFLRLETLMAAGGLPDTLAGWKCYADFLAWQAEEGPAGRSKVYVNLSQGWAIGGAGFKSSLLRDHAVTGDTRAWDVQEEVRELKWREALDRALAVVGKTSREIASAAKSAPWKLAVACWLKAHTHASNHWLSQHLNLGHRASVSSNLTRYRRRVQPTDPLWQRLTQHFAA
jgi:putative transposase